MEMKNGSRNFRAVLDPEATGERIRMLRIQRGLSVEELARMVGDVSVQTIYKWQRGESVPSADNMIPLSEILQVPVDGFLCRKYLAA
ncbi:MAG: helix-turn-helix transcriptional regulator [Lachnospiraceae bacterium]|nr:helix-turn-helix transcriptional regulator [Lachnospiraceae bacterium]